ncbi:hypothetical protein HYY69_04210 [Candidatus Woesearchaeota archaeon]|nr:hypothetical protein [Candidatus Woesearchaeota archaeon]
MMNLPKNEVKVKCRKCSRDAIASEFRMDIDAKMMVCPNCIREKGSPKNARIMPNTSTQQAMNQARISLGLNRSSPQAPQQASVPDGEGEESRTPRPAGWDKDDDILEKLYSQKKKKVESFKPMPGSGTKLKYVCQQCTYTFSYDSEKKTPRSCPYCQRSVPDIF